MKKISASTKVILTCVLIFLAVPLYLLVRQREITITGFTDCLFMVGLAFLCIGAFLAVIQSGFFDFFQKSMKGFLRRKEAVQIPEVKPLSENISHVSFTFWFPVAGICILVSLFLLLFI